jgi:hypothetical protein
MLVSDLLQYSLRIAGVLGVGQVPLAQDTSDCLQALAMMLSQWQRKRWLIYRLDELTCPIASGQPSYTIGPTPAPPSPPPDLNYNIRPGDISAAYIRQLIGTSGPSSLPVDFPLSRIDSREEWSKIALKNLRSWPGRYFYDPTFPLGTFYIWPVPIQTFFELYVTIEQDIRVDLDPTTEIENYLPAETEEALVYNLAARLRVNYQLPPSQDLNAMARATLGTLRSANFRIQKLQLPAALGRGGRWKNPAAGFYPEMAVGVPYTVTGP